MGTLVPVLDCVGIGWKLFLELLSKFLREIFRAVIIFSRDRLEMDSKILICSFFFDLLPEHSKTCILLHDKLILYLKIDSF